MKGFIVYGKETKDYYQKIIFRCVKEIDMDYIIRKLKLNRSEIKIYYEKPIDPYNCEWRGLPEFKVNEDVYPYIKIIFETEKHKKDFYKTIEKTYVKKNSDWYPDKPRYLPCNSYWNSILPIEKQKNKYPIYVISKGRYNNRLTSDWLSKNKIYHNLVVEHCEKDKYSNGLKDYINLLVMEKKYDNLGCGSIPVRNWIQKRSKRLGVKKYWCIDDNIDGFFRFYKNTRIEMRTPLVFRLTEEFADRYENLHMCGLQYYSFCPDISKRRTVVGLNTRIYSCILMSVELENILDGVLWRGKYNEDTDLSLRLLKKGYPTCLLYSFLCRKRTTMSCKGGNTDSIYQNGGLQKKLDSLINQHPDCVKGTVKFKKVHHQVNYSKFKKNKLKLKEGIEIREDYDDWGLKIFIDF